MKGFIALLHCLVLATSLFSPFAAPAAETFQGTVMGAANGELILMMGTESSSFRIEPGAVITLDGKPADLSQLKTGYSATVTAHRDGKELTAKAIAVKSG